MMFFKSALLLPALALLASAMTLEHSEYAMLSTESIKLAGEADSFAVAGASSNACGKEDDSDCTEYCGATGATASCKADGNKVTCYCKGKGDDAGEKCEERCLLCMPGKSLLEEAKDMFRLGGSHIDEL